MLFSISMKMVQTRWSFYSKRKNKIVQNNFNLRFEILCFFPAEETVWMLREFRRPPHEHYVLTSYIPLWFDRFILLLYTPIHNFHWNLWKSLKWTLSSNAHGNDDLQWRFSPCYKIWLDLDITPNKNGTGILKAKIPFDWYLNKLFKDKWKMGRLWSLNDKWKVPCNKLFKKVVLCCSLRPNG